MPAISIVMPVYNRAQTVGRAIDSVLQQTFVDFELVVVDNASEDNTVEVIKAIADPRIRLLFESANRGGNAARNRGVREAVSPLISFLDSDDEFLPHKLSTIVNYFKASPEVDAVLDSFTLRYPKEKGGAVAPRINPAINTSEAVREAIFARRVFKATPALSARKAALLKAGLFDETLRRRQDMDMVLRLAATCNMRTITDVLWTKYWTDGAISSKQETFMAAILAMGERYPEYLADKRYRKGLARDFARHFLRLGLKGRLSTIRNDIARYRASGLPASGLSLFAEGVREIITRAVKPR